MFSTRELYNKKVFISTPKGARKRYGHLRSIVFHPSKAQAIGVIVKRPDMAMMIKRKDRFVALDRIEISAEGPLIIDQEDTWDKAACRRMGVDFEKCILWDYMPVRTKSGRELGQISSVIFDEGDFMVDHIDISSDSAARKILGAANIGRAQILGYADGAIIVADSVGDVEEAGGIAAQAGVAWATAKHKGSQAASKAGKAAGEAVDKGAFKVGEAVGSLKNAAGDMAANAKAAATRDELPEATPAASGDDGKAAAAAQAVGKQLGRASNMFKDFKTEFDKASRGE